MPGIALQGNLPADGSAHGFDKNSDALDISHVNMAKYVEAADHTLDLAIATQPAAADGAEAADLAGQPARLRGPRADATATRVLLKNKQPDPDFPPPASSITSIKARTNGSARSNTGSSVGVFRHEDESFNPYFIDFVDDLSRPLSHADFVLELPVGQGQVLPARGTEAARLSVVQLTGDGRGGGHPSYVLGYYDAPSLDREEHEFVTWLNYKETIGFNAASLAPAANYSRKGRAMAFTGPGIACDWLRNRRSAARRLAAGEPSTAVRRFAAGASSSRRTSTNWCIAPQRKPMRQEVGRGKNRPDPRSRQSGPCRATTRWPMPTACWPRSCRRRFAVPSPTRSAQAYVGTGRRASEDRRLLRDWPCAGPIARRSARPTFCTTSNRPDSSTTMRLAYRLSYFLWNSLPDDQLTELAAAGELQQAGSAATAKSSGC